MNNDLTTFDDIANNISVSEYSNTIIDKLNNGEIDAVSLAIKIKYFEEIFDNLKNDLRDAVILELNKYNKNETVSKFNAEIKLKEAGVKYDFSNCNDDEYNQLESEIAKLTQQRKDREKFLKSINGSIVTCIESTGEVVTLFAPIKSSSTTYMINLKNK